MEQSPNYSNGRPRPRNAGPTPADGPSRLNQPKTGNPYESSSDRKARVEAERARQNPVPKGQRGRGQTEIPRERAMPQMPALPREGMQGLDPQAPNDIRTPFHYYPNFDQGIPPEILDSIRSQQQEGANAPAPEDERIATAILKMFGLIPKQDYTLEDENGRMVNPGRGGMMNGPDGPMMPYLPQFHSEMGMLPGGAGQWMMQNPLNFIP